jgi:hypothetical protein
MRGAILCVLACSGIVRGQDIADRLPASTRLLVGIHVKQLTDSPLAKKHGEPLRAMFTDWATALVNLGADPAQVEHVWIAAGDGYPRGTAVLITGKAGAAQLDAKLQQHIRERRMAVRPFREENRPCYSLETPVGLNPIPGLPATVFVSARDDGIIVTFDQETLTLLLRPIEATKSARERFAAHKDALAAPNGFVAACSPPESLTATDGLLAGVKSIVADAVVEDGLTIKIEIRADNVAVFQSRLADGLTQARQLFVPLATQQGFDPKLMQFIHDLLANAKIETKDDVVTLTSEMNAEAVGRTIKK